MDAPIWHIDFACKLLCYFPSHTSYSCALAVINQKDRWFGSRKTFLHFTFVHDWNDFLGEMEWFFLLFCKSNGFGDSLWVLQSHEYLHIKMLSISKIFSMDLSTLFPKISENVCIPETIDRESERNRNLLRKRHTASAMTIHKFTRRDNWMNWWTATIKISCFNKITSI